MSREKGKCVLSAKTISSKGEKFFKAVLTVCPFRDTIKMQFGA